MERYDKYAGNLMDPIDIKKYTKKGIKVLWTEHRIKKRPPNTYCGNSRWQPLYKLLISP